MGNHWEMNEQRLWGNIMTLAQITNLDKPWTRRPFTSSYEEGRAFVTELMTDAGLTVYKDASSNVIGRIEGTEPNWAPILIGSHTDTVSSGGRFDGIIGVLIGIEIVKCLQEQGQTLRHTVEIVDFTAEEPTDFGISTVGSRGMVGTLTKEMLSLKDPEGRTLEEAIRFAGGKPEEIEGEIRKTGDVALYLEIHTEQGPVLIESEKILAAVTGIVGIQRYRITLTGQPDHAGTTPMSMRKDALTGAGQLFTELESICNEEYDSPIVGTVGTVSVYPNAANVVPGQVTFTFEVRSIDANLVEQTCQRFISFAENIASERGLSINAELLSKSDPIVVSDVVRNIIVEACEETVGHAVSIPSGAGHDANQLAKIAPVGMIFVPSKGGRSHCPEEWTESSHIADGAKALSRALISFDEKIDNPRFTF